MVRKGDLVLTPGRRGEPDSRVIRLPGPPEVLLRTLGDRDISSIPGSELAEFAGRIHERQPDLDRAGLKRRVAGVLGQERYTAALDKLLEAVIPGE